MAFRYTTEPVTQHLLLGAVLGGGLVLNASGVASEHWASLVSSSNLVVLLIVVPFLLHLVVFWLVAGAFHLVDTRGAPEAVVRYRIEDGRLVRPPLARTLPVLAVNQLVFAPLMLGAMALALWARGWTPSTDLPSTWRLIGELAALSLSAVVIFYATHRLLHRPWWMKRVHRIHHEFRATSALASEYAHPVEYCIGNFGALAGGVVLFAPHLLTIYLFTVLSLITIIVHHSGYALPWAPWSVPHAWHHHRYKELFGTYALLDRVLGTAPEFFTLHDGDRR